jgi:catechol 2,3-dioxygenase-like lactoylglutathione lyase family enzyme
MNRIIKGMGVHHIALRATDFDRSLAFYKALGLTEKVAWGDGDGRAAMLDFGDGNYLELFANGEKGDETDKRFYHLALRADDVDSAFEIALKAGATPKNEPMVVSPENPTSPLSMKIAFVYGPDGEIIEFFKEI